MKHFLVLSFTLLFMGSAMGQTTEKTTTDTVKEDAVLKEHVCSKSCMDGKHAYMHGEKGHACSDECMKMHAKDQANMKEHTCTKACTAEKHAYACGEKGHVCSADCKKRHGDAKQAKPDMNGGK